LSFRLSSAGDHEQVTGSNPVIGSSSDLLAAERRLAANRVGSFSL